MFLSKIILACHTDSNPNQILSRDVRKYTIISPFSEINQLSDLVSDSVVAECCIRVVSNFVIINS